MLAIASGAQAGVLSPGTSVEGRSQAEWTADWWQWALSFPIADSPMFDTVGSQAASGNTAPVFFVAGSFGGDVTRTFSVPAGTSLFVPVVNNIAFQTATSDTEASLRALAEPTNVASMWATLNGVSLNPQLTSHRQQSPLFYLNSPLLAEFGYCWKPGLNPADPGDPTCYVPPSYSGGMAVSDGYWLMLEPLAIGQTYELVVGGLFTDGTQLNITSNITAVPEPSTITLLGGAVMVLALGMRRRRTGAGGIPV